MKTSVHKAYAKIASEHNSGTCYFPNLEPYGPEVKRFVKVRKHHDCGRWNLITYREGMKLIVNKTVTSHYPLFANCSYQPYVKEVEHDSRKLFLKERFRTFNESIDITDQFCMVSCFNTKKMLLGQQHFASVIRNETLMKLRQGYRSDIANPALRRPMDVVMVGLESTSRLNFLRQMNYTKAFLDSISTVDMLGYNKAGLNTLPNTAPILTGMTLHEMNISHGFFDKYPFVWKDYMNAGYLTFFSEDASSFGIFNYLNSGFKYLPVDYYMRQFISGLESTNRNQTNKLCSGNSLILQAVFDQLSEFITTYHDVPKFAFSNICKPTHDNANGLGIEDLPLARTLTSLQKRGALDNTVLIVFGDHGSRYGNIRNTYQGRIEENMPALFISLPLWFRQEQRELYENLKSNRKKLTSNIDIYATLQDILEIGKGHIAPSYNGKYGTSLLRNIRTNRTCEDLKIPTHFCVCQNFYSIYSTESKIVREISLWVVKEINTMLVNVPVCVDLALNNISHAWKSMNTTNVTSPLHGDYVIQFSVLPSHAEFEVTVMYYGERFSLLGDILRTNKYERESYCVSSHKNMAVLERYCYCRDQLSSSNFINNATPT
ncbi:uncharacterized protein [Argopecten irradians]|uniref:uncharacterized protein n=1 Tax=Argopecten irradians TaxID=31199 RepID=UPI003720EF10